MNLNLYSIVCIPYYKNSVSSIKYQVIVKSEKKLLKPLFFFFLDDHTCNNVEAILDLGKHEPIYHEHARPCSGGDSMNEAVLMKYCFAPKPSNWTQGRKVLYGLYTRNCCKKL